MARATRDSRLDSRAARDKIKTGPTRHWRGIAKGLSLGYRKGKTGGTWYARLYLKNKGKHQLEGLGKADDYQDANGIDVLDYFQAQDAARAFANKVAEESLNEGSPTPVTVGEVITDYLKWFKTEKKSYYATSRTCVVHIIPDFGDRPVNELTTKELRDWHHKLANRKAKLRTGKGAKNHNTRETTDNRARKASANRILTVLKAALNYAWNDDAMIAKAPVWREVKPFKNVDGPKIRYLSQAECKRLINACSPDFRWLVQAALYTGTRYGELIQLKTSDFNPDARSIHIGESKGGKSRNIPLTEQGQAFFSRLAVGKKHNDLLFLRDDGQPWRPSQQARPIKKACEIASINPPITIHGLRHTYGAALAMQGVPLQVIAAALGHADTRITEKHYAHLKPNYIADTIRANLPDLGMGEMDNVVVMK